MLPIAELLIRPVQLRVGGRTWPVLITYGVLLECESLTGADLFGGLANMASVSAGILRGLLWAALRRAGSELGPREIGDLITPRNFLDLRWQLAVAFATSMPDPKRTPTRISPEVRPETVTKLGVWASAHDLGLSDSEWLAMTPRQFHELRELRIARMQREELMFSRLTAKVINFSTCHPEKPVPDDLYMIHPLPAVEEGPMTGEHMMAAMAIFKRGR